MAVHSVGQAVTADDLIAFEQEVIEAFRARKIAGPIHLSGGNEQQLIDIFRDVRPSDWIFSTYRSHYHALLHGIPRDRVMQQILTGHSMNLAFPEHHFYTSAIVAGCLPIAVGVAAACKRSENKRHVWCFVGDMAASIGAFHDAQRYASGHDLPITFIIEDNGLACDTPTERTWGGSERMNVECYSYERQYPHVGVGEWIAF